jgi:hypothetical protein
VDKIHKELCERFETVLDCERSVGSTIILKKGTNQVIAHCNYDLNHVLVSVLSHCGNGYCESKTLSTNDPECAAKIYMIVTAHYL